MFLRGYLHSLGLILRLCGHLSAFAGAVGRAYRGRAVTGFRRFRDLSRTGIVSEQPQ